MGNLVMKLLPLSCSAYSSCLLYPVMRFSVRGHWSHLTNIQKPNQAEDGRGKGANLSSLWSRQSVQRKWTEPHRTITTSQKNHSQPSLLSSHKCKASKTSIRQFCSQSKTFCMVVGSASYQGYSLSAPVSFMTGDGSSFINWYKNKTAHVTRPGSLHVRVSLQRPFSPLSLLIQSVQTFERDSYRIFPVPQTFLIAVLGCSQCSSCTITCTWKMISF